jgi:hypothetical protein
MYSMSTNRTFTTTAKRRASLGANLPYTLYIYRDRRKKKREDLGASARDHILGKQVTAAIGSIHGVIANDRWSGGEFWLDVASLDTSLATDTRRRS